MTWVKVCGLRSIEEIDVAVEAGADAVGLMVADSPRQISESDAQRLAQYTQDVHLGILTFAVTTDCPPDHMVDLVATLGVSGVQPHGAYSEEAAVAARSVDPDIFVLRPVGVDLSRGLGEWKGMHPDHTPMFDTKLPNLSGGSGVSFDWTLVGEVDRNFVLAGGLNPFNIGAAIAATRAWGVDASSGLESSLGIKDLSLVRAFVQGAKT